MTRTTHRRRLMLATGTALAGVLFLSACSTDTDDTDKQQLVQPEQVIVGQRRPGQEDRPRVLRPRRRPRLAGRHQQLGDRGGQELLRRRAQERGGHQRPQPADQPGRDLHQRQGRRDRAAADRRRRAHRCRHQGDGGRHPGRQRRPRVLHPVRRADHGPRRQLRHGCLGRDLRLPADRGQGTRQATPSWPRSQASTPCP